MSKIILGTAQMGMAYGINNFLGKISLQESHEILIRAYKEGIRSLDTAQIYGDAHMIIGRFHAKYSQYKFKIVTKAPQIDFTSFDDDVHRYLSDLNVYKLDGLMFHSFENYSAFKNNGNSLADLKNNLVNHLGVSVYTNHQLKEVIEDEDIGLIQLPFNIFDNYSKRGELMKEAKKAGKIVHCRSCFLQGLFFMNPSNSNPVVTALKKELNQLQRISKKYDLTIAELALCYCLYQKEIDNVLIGVDNLLHLESNIQASNISLPEEVIYEINEIHVENENMLNPSLWNQKLY